MQLELALPWFNVNPLPDRLKLKALHDLHVHVLCGQLNLEFPVDVCILLRA